MNKLTHDFQKQFSSHLLFDQTVRDRIDPEVTVHDQADNNPLSSAAACLNVIGSLATDPRGLKMFLEKATGLVIEEVYEFPSGVDFGGRTYQDKGYAIFEWIGPKKSPLSETGSRGKYQTSVDAFVLARINGKTTQLLIEWKFTEGDSRPLALGRFCGGQGLERLKRYTTVLAKMRRDLRKEHREEEFPFLFSEEDYKESKPATALGLYDLSPDHLYQLLRMTLLARTTVGSKLGDHVFEDYRIVHLTHSKNDKINTLQPEYLVLSPGLKQYSGWLLHNAWKAILSHSERARFCHGHWDEAIKHIENPELKKYLSERYE